MAPNKAPAMNPARASHLATTTLTKILELTRLHKQGHALPSSLTSGVSKSLLQLRNAVIALEAEQRELESTSQNSQHNRTGRIRSQEELKTREDLLVGLSKQYHRLVGLCDGLGIPAEGLHTAQHRQSVQEADDTSTPETHLLIDSRTSIDADVPLQDLHQKSSNRASTSSTSSPHASLRIDADDEQEQSRMDEEEMRAANQDVMQMQQKMMSDQDDTLEALAKAISRQRDLSLHISSELELHENLLEETDRAVDGTEARLRRASKRLDNVAQRSRESTTACAIITIIVVLLILVVVIKL